MFDSDDDDMIPMGRAAREVRNRQNFMHNSNASFYKRFRLTEETFNTLFAELQPHIAERSRKYYALSPEEDLKVALRFLADGAHYRVIGDSFGIDEATVCRSIRRNVDLLSNHIYRQHCRWPAAEEFQQIRQGLFQRAGFPNLCGLIDGSLIGIKAPSEDEHMYVDRHGNHSIQMQIVCDHNFRILNSFCQYPGSVADSRVLRLSPLFNRFQMRNYRPFANATILGDSGYPLTDWLLTPILGQNLNVQQLAYNTCHKKTRFLVENTIGLLKIRYRCLLTPLRVNTPAYAADIVRACCALHNYSISNGIIQQNEIEEADEMANEQIGIYEPDDA